VQRDPNSTELSALAPLLVLADAPKLVGSITLVSNGARVIGVTSAEILRRHQGQRLGVASRLDGSAIVEITTWGIGRYAGLALVELPASLPAGGVAPLAITSVHASVDVHHAPSAVVKIVAGERGYVRSLIPVHADRYDGGGMDRAAFLASPIEPGDGEVEGAPVFAWLPPEPALGRRGEVVLFAIAYPYRGHAAPRDLPVIGELLGLDDLGRALIGASEPDDRPELETVAGEIDDHHRDPLAGLED
jgi:hypothetical protein